MGSFSVSFSDKDPVRVLALHGELDAHTASELEAAFEESMNDGHYRIVVDGSDLKYISSAGLGVFMAFIEEVRQHGGDIKVAALQASVYNVFDLLGFPLLFEIFDSQDQAVERFAQNSSRPT